MAPKLKSVLKDPVSPLVLKAGLLSIAIFWLRFGVGSWWKTILFLLLFAYFYFRPSINAGKYLISVIALLSIVVLTPRVGGLVGFYISTILGLMVFMLLGVKNLIFVKRQNIYYWLHLMLLVGIGGLYFLGSIGQILLFLGLTFLIREFYINTIKQTHNIVNLTAVVEGMVLTQAGWVMKFFPTSFLISSSFLVLVAFVLHDVLVNHYKSTLTKELVMRDVAVLIVLSIIILLMPVWGFR